MATYHVDLVNGNDASAGTSWGTAWKTFTNGPTAARIVAGDVVKFAKTADPVSIGTVSWANNIGTVTIPAGLYKEVNQATTTWTVSTNITGATSAVRKIGSTSFQITPSAAFTTGKMAYTAVTGGGTQDFSLFTKLSFYFYTASGPIASGTYRIALCSDTAGDTVVDSFPIPRIPTGGKFASFTLPRTGGGSLGSSIQSVAIYADVDPGTVQIRINHIIATNDLGLGDIIGKSGEYGHVIKSVTSTTLTLERTDGTAGSSDSYVGATESVTTYVTPSFKLADETFALFESGSATAAKVTYTGGWDTGTDTRNGRTIINMNTSFSGQHYSDMENFGFLTPSSTINFQGYQTIRNCIIINGATLISRASGTTGDFYDCILAGGGICSGMTTSSAIFYGCTIWTSSFVTGNCIRLEFHECTFPISPNQGGGSSITAGLMLYNRCTFTSNNMANSPISFPTRSRDHLKVIIKDSIGTTYSNYIHVAGTTARWQTTIKQGSDPGAWEIASTSSPESHSTNPYLFKIADIAVTAGSTVTVTAWVKKLDASNSISIGRLSVPSYYVEGVDYTSSEHGANLDWENLSVTFSPTANGILPVNIEFITSTSFVTIYVGSINVTTA